MPAFIVKDLKATVEELKKRGWKRTPARLRSPTDSATRFQARARTNSRYSRTWGRMCSHGTSQGIDHLANVNPIPGPIFIP